MAVQTSMNRKDLFLRACRGETVARVPVWMMRQAGRYLPEYREIRARHGFLEVCKTPELAVEVSLQPFRRLSVDAVIVFSDILIPAEAMGLPVELGDAGPKLPCPVRSQADVEKLGIFDPEAETGFLPEAIRRIVKSVGPEVAVLGFAGAPWTLACYMVEGQTKEGFATVKQFLYQEPKTFRELLHRIAQATVPYLKAQIAAGATAIQLFDTWCGELNLEDYQESALPAVQEVISEISGSVPVIYYTKASPHLLLAAARSGVCLPDSRTRNGGKWHDPALPLTRPGAPIMRKTLALASLALALAFTALTFLDWGDKSYGFATDPYSSFYFLITGFHLAHVVSGGEDPRSYPGHDPFARWARAHSQSWAWHTAQYARGECATFCGNRAGAAAGDAPCGALPVRRPSR